MDSPYSPLEFALLNQWQRDFPLCKQPFENIAEKVGAGETAVLQTLTRLHARGAISRVGAVFAPRRIGASTLAAVAAPLDRLEEIADIISARPEVNHNYQREHHFNLWFVAAADNPEALEAALNAIETATGCRVLSLPLEQEYHIDLGFDLSSANKHHSKIPAAIASLVTREPEPHQKKLIAALQPGLALLPRPFAHLAEQCGMSENAVITQLGAWLDEKLIKRFGVVVRHHELGFRANAMVVFDLADNEIDTIAPLLAREPGVTLCYRRSRSLPDWPYNLYCMVHGRSREDVAPTVERLSAMTGSKGLPLFSTRRFKQCGARYFADTHSAKQARG